MLRRTKTDWAESSQRIIKYIMGAVACLMMLMIVVPANVYATETETIRGTGTVTADSLNVRSGPGKDYEAVGKVYRDNVLEVIGMENDWFKINYNNTEGYVSSEYMLYEPDEELLTAEDTVDEPQTDMVTEPEAEDETEIVASGPEKYKIIFGLIAVIVVVLIIILITIKSIRNMDDDYYEDDDVDYDEDDEDEYEDDEYEEDDDVDYEDEDEDEDDGYEYEHIVIRKPKQSTIEKGSKKDDYLIDIDPRYFD